MTDQHSEHPIQELERLVAGDATAAEQARAVRHLLAGCGRCTRRAAQEMGLGRPRPAGALDAVLARLVDRAPAWLAQVQAERAEARELVAALEDEPRQRSLALLAAAPRHLKRAVCEQLIERSTSARQRDAAATLRYAEQAVAVAEQIGGLGSDELRVRAWAELGNARRIANDLAGADAAFAEASTWFERGGADPLLRADFLAMLASLRDYQRRHAEALSLIRRAANLYRRYGQPEAVATALIQESSIHAKAGDTEQGLAAVWEGLSLLGPGADLDLLLLGIHNLIYLIVDTGEFRAALRLIEAARPLYRACAGELALLRRDWLRGRIHVEAGELQQGVEELEEVRRHFADRDLAYEVAVVSLDLALAHARRGDTARLRSVAAETLPVFRQLGVARDTLASLAALRHALAQDAATVAIIRGLAEKVESAREGRSLLSVR